MKNLNVQKAIIVWSVKVNTDEKFTIKFCEWKSKISRLKILLHKTTIYQYPRIADLFKWNKESIDFDENTGKFKEKNNNTQVVASTLR